MKRAVDIIGAVTGLILLAPVFLVVMWMVKQNDPGPVIFRQMRIGRFGKPFHILKFRSMKMEAESLLRADPQLWKLFVENGYKLPEGQDPRITPIGRWLRKTSLDELPQLWNVLVGEMSLVGPRPVVQDELDQWYGPRAAELLSVRPGMTGLWQVSGRSEINYPERADLELRYVRDQSLIGDIAILFRTLLVVVRGRGAH